MASGLEKMNFPFTEFLGLAEDRVFRPLIPITFGVKNKSFDGYALIDSGADYNFLPISIAESLKLDLSCQPSYSISAADGKPFTVHKSPVELDHIIKKAGQKPIKWKSFVYFSDSDGDILLGDSGFLNQFKVTLDGKKREIEISE